jgi:hypothetical protein
MGAMRRSLLALALLLALTACGDDGPTLEERRAEYREEAETVCAVANAESAQLSAPSSVDAVPEFADQAVALVRDTVADLEELEPPEEDAEEVEERMLAPLREDVAVAEDYAEQLRAAAAANDVATLLGLAAQRPQTSADLEWMREYGLPECARAADQTS